MNGVSINEILSLVNLNIIDVRDNYNYNMGHIDGAINIPYYSLISNYGIYLDINKKYYLYCNYGKKSMEISDYLNSLGYNTYYIKEGYLDFKNKIK